MPEEIGRKVPDVFKLVEKGSRVIAGGPTTLPPTPTTPAASHNTPSAPAASEATAAANIAATAPSAKAKTSVNATSIVAAAPGTRKEIERGA